MRLELNLERRIAGTLLVLAFLAQPATAQLVDVFTKDDCNGVNNPCGNAECDAVNPPVIPILPNRTAAPNARVQYVLIMENNNDTESGLVLTDQLPSCVQIDCSGACADLDCNGIPEPGAVKINFSAGGASDAPVCDQAGNRLTIPNISLGRGERMEVRYCAQFTASGNCCNDATLEDPAGGGTQTSTDGLIAGQQQVCVDVNQAAGGSWKDDCGPRTGHADDCDDIGVNANGQRAVNPPLPASGKRIRWVLQLEAGAGEFLIEDEVPMDQTVICRDFQDPWGENWGCFAMYLNGQEIDRGFDDGCINGPGGGIEVRETLQAGDVLQVHFCARFNDDVGQMSCNRHAMYRSPPNASQRSPFVDHYTGERQTCILAEASRIQANKTITNLSGGVAGPGDTVEYRIELCETSGNSDVSLHFQDWFPNNLANPTLSPATANFCQLLGGGASMLCMFLNLPADGCRNPTVIEFEGTVTCDGLADGSTICNRGQLEIRDPYDPLPVYTDDPDLPGETDQTCFQIVLDNLDDSTKTVDLTFDADGDTLPDCEDDVLTYTIVVVSNGSADAEQVELEDELPPEAIFMSGSLRLDGNPLPDPVPPGTILVDLSDIPTGDSRTLTFEVRAADMGAGNYILSNQGVLSSRDTRLCGTTVVTDDPRYPDWNEPTEIEIICSAPEFGDAAKSVSDTEGQPVTEGWPGMDLVYTVDWCNSGTGAATNVQFEDLLPVCVEYVGPTTLNGNDVVPDPYDPGPPPAVRFVADPNQVVGECHVVEIPVRVADHQVLCPEGTVVDNVASISSDEGIVQETDDGSPTRFTIAPPPTGLRRSMVLDSLVGGCLPDQPRLDETREIVPGPAFPVCIDGDGSLGGARMLVFYELAGDCDGVLRMVRTECSDAADTITDLEAAYP